MGPRGEKTSSAKANLTRPHPATEVRPSLRLDFNGIFRLGPGKIELLERIMETGSISAAGRAMDMSYRRAWLLVDSLNQMFVEPAVIKTTGGVAGGGAEVTEFGRRLVAAYRAVEKRVAREAASVFSSFQIRMPEEK
jgi:molybdate transport system regulatory protein